MPVPPRGDLTRPLVLAANAGRLLGVLFLCFAAVVVAAGVFRSGGRPPGGPPGFMVVLFGAGGFLTAAGAGFWVLGELVRRRRAWAAIVLMVLASLLAVYAAAVVGVSLVAAFGLGVGGGGARTLGLAPMLIPAVLLACAVLLIVYCAQSLRAIRELAVTPTTPMGFQPIMAAEVPAGAGPADYSPGVSTRGVYPSDTGPEDVPGIGSGR